MICVKVPATTANFGAGFDSLGAALDYYNCIWMEEWDGCWIEILDDTDVPTDETNLIYQTAKALYGALRVSVPGTAYPSGEPHSHSPGAGQFLGLHSRRTAGRQ